ncbi:MAG: hypothetical protein GF334_00550, partial [Candidatus Altiarchaeales archaeon]|nr:hypothetical protein [Candidatus Altiarchaeales archaeon]
YYCSDGTKCVNDGDLFNPGYVHCEGSGWSKECGSGGDWVSQETCDYGCTEGTGCNPPPTTTTSTTTTTTTIPYTCDNGVYNALYETDTDCGRNCPGCSLGKSCVVNDDCLGNLYCNPDSVCSIGELRLTPALKFSQTTEELTVQAQAFDPTTGEYITSSTGTYRVENETTTLATGDLTYIGGVWEDTQDLTPIDIYYGSYNVEITIQGNGKTGKTTQTFSKVPGTSNIYGLVESGQTVISGALVYLYNSTEFYNNPGVSPISSDETDQHGLFYFGDIPSGEYILLVSATGFVNEQTDAFTITGLNKEFVKNFQLTSEAQTLAIFNSKMSDLRYSLNNLMNHETKIYANITGRVTEDLEGESEAFFVVDTLLDATVLAVEGVQYKVLGKPALSKTTQILTNSIQTTFINKICEELPEYVLRDAIVKAIDIHTPKKEIELKKLNIFNSSIEKLNLYHTDFRNSSSQYYLDSDFDVSAARRVLADQERQVNMLMGSESDYIVSPFSPVTGLGTYITRDASYIPYEYHLSHSYNGYMVFAALHNFLDTLHWELFKLQVTETGLFLSCIGLAPETGGATSVAVPPLLLATHVTSVSKHAVSIGDDVGTNIPLAILFTFSGQDWVREIQQTPYIYSDTTMFLKDESADPYYLNKNNNFDLDVYVDMNYDTTISDHNFIYLKKFEFFDADALVPSVNPMPTVISRSANINVTNTGNVESKIRVTASGYWDYHLLDTEFLSSVSGNKIPDFFKEIKKLVLPTSYWYDYGIGDQNPGKSETYEFMYTGFYVDPVNALHPHTVKINAYSGPFLVYSEPQYYYPLPLEVPISYDVLSLPESSSHQVLGVQTEGSQGNGISLEEFMQLTPEINLILNTTIQGDSPILEINYSVSVDAKSVEFHLFHPQESDIDLHTYDGEGNHLGYSVETDALESEFTGEYSGKETNPEIVEIRNSDGKSYSLRVKLNNPTINESRRIQLYALEIPSRPPVISVSPPVVNRFAVTKTNVSLGIILAEGGLQKSLTNVSVSISNLKNNKSGKTLNVIGDTTYTFDSIPAMSKELVEYSVFIPSDAVFGSYVGNISVVSDNAGELIIPVEIAVIGKSNASISTDYSINQNYSMVITATVKDDFGVPIEKTVVEFFLSNPDLVEIPCNQTLFFTDENGQAKLILEGIENGVLNVTAIEAGGSYSRQQFPVVMQGVQIIHNLPQFLEIAKNNLFDFTMQVVCFNKQGCEDIQTILDPILLGDGKK